MTLALADASAPANSWPMRAVWRARLLLLLETTRDVAHTVTYLAYL